MGPGQDQADRDVDPVGREAPGRDRVALRRTAPKVNHRPTDYRSCKTVAQTLVCEDGQSLITENLAIGEIMRQARAQEGLACLFHQK